MPRARRWSVLVLGWILVASICWPAAPARADGDPASDVLLSANLFLPYEPVSESSARTLTRTTAALAALKDPIKVAIIATPSDLGAVPSLFDKPQAYARYLGVELSYYGPPHVLVVMPDGYGTADLSAKATSAVSRLARPASAKATTLALAAIAAEVQIARADGHSIAAAARPVPSPGSAGPATAHQHRAHSPVRLILVVLLGAIAVAGAIALVLPSLRGRRRRADA